MSSQGQGGSQGLLGSLPGSQSLSQMLASPPACFCKSCRPLLVPLTSSKGPAQGSRLTFHLPAGRGTNCFLRLRPWKNQSQDENTCSYLFSGPQSHSLGAASLESAQGLLHHTGAWAAQPCLSCPSGWLSDKCRQRQCKQRLGGRCSAST